MLGLVPGKKREKSTQNLTYRVLGLVPGKKRKKSKHLMQNTFGKFPWVFSQGLGFRVQGLGFKV